MKTAERAAHLRYWQSELQGPHYQSLDTLMLLDPDGEAYSAEEVAGTLNLLPPLPPAAFIVELAAGAGRFTPWFAARAGRVLANDLIPEFIAMNQQRCAAAGFDNIEFRVGDATEFVWPEAGSVQLVFINWLLMYLSDDEAREVLARALKSLAPDGRLFLHESGDLEVAPETAQYAPYSDEYPARYRHPSWYRAALTDAALPYGQYSLNEYDLASLYAKSQCPGVQPAWLLRRLP